MENNQESQVPQVDKPQEVVASKPARKQKAMWLLVVLLVLSLAGNGFLWMQLQKAQKDLRAQRADNQSLQDQVEKLKSQVGGEDAIGQNGGAAGIEETSCTYTPGNALKDNIIAALDSKNTAAFATYVTDPVMYVLAASEFGGEQSPDGAATALAYTHSATSPWKFVDAAGYSSGDYARYFDKKALAVKSADGMVVAFDFSCDGSKINSIFVAPSEAIL